MKQYNGEKAIISMTSWKARINTVSKTLFSLIKQCPGFHIVLVLSEEEFPEKEKELPKNLMFFVNNNFIEILWVYKNYKSFKKVLFTIDKYKNVPVISADDDCLYTCNYAEELYNNWLKNKSSVITCERLNVNGWTISRGPTTLFAPNVFKQFDLKILDNMKEWLNDDAFYSALYKKYNINVLGLNKRYNYGFIFHDEIHALSKNENNRCWQNDMPTYFNFLNQYN